MIDSAVKTGTCVFSPDRAYRYTLNRVWNQDLTTCMFIGLNPSTADENQNDPTVTRCINYAREWGYGSLVMTNIFGFRATDPKDMKADDDPVGPDNDYWLRKTAERSGIVIAAWGTHGAYLDRGNEVVALIPDLHCLKVTKDGFPSHPLYLKKNLNPIIYKKGIH